MKPLIFFSLAAIALLGAGCESSQNAYPQHPKAFYAVEAQGFTDIQLGSTPLFSCAQDDSMLESYSFTAKNQNGKIVSGSACCGFWKGCTIRF